MMTHLERHRELCLLSSFISEQGKWLDSVLGQLKWSKDSLQSGCGFVQCPHNEHHYIPSESLEAHKTSCFYATKGVSRVSLDESCPLVVRKDALYQDKYVPSIEIDAAIERAVKVTAQDPELYQEKGTNKPQPSPDGVEDCVSSGIDVTSLTPHQAISYIKSWRKVPLDWTSIVPSSLDLTQLKGWLFQNIPREHAHSASVGGEMVVVDTIVQALTQEEAPSVTPNAVVNTLKSLLRANASSFVLSLWKHVHISRTLERGGLAGGVVEDIAPMHLTQLLTLQRGAPQMREEEAPLVYKIIKELMGGASPSPDHTPPLPMDAVFYSSSPTERRVMYDYVVGAGQVKVPKEKKKIDPDLYRNDEAVLKAKLKALAQQEQGGGDQDRPFHELLRERKEKRDYKRRRQKYRAKNVHITRRKTSEIFHDIINNRMDEIAETLRPQLKNASNLDTTTEQSIRTIQHSDAEDVHSIEKSQRTKQEDEQRPSSRRKRHLSRSKSRSRSRERHHSHKKHKKHKSHKHSSSSKHSSSREHRQD